jgi:hypothetical protein
MPATKTPRTTSSKDLNAAIERVAPDVLALLADGVPRNTATIVAALAEQHLSRTSRAPSPAWPSSASSRCGVAATPCRRSRRSRTESTAVQQTTMR